MDDVRDRVGLLCDQLTRHSMEQLIRDAGAGEELGALRAVLRNDQDADADRLRALLDALEDACLRSGLSGVASRQQGYRPLPPGLSPNSQHDRNGSARAWVCPLRRCARVVLPEEAAADVPICAMGNEMQMSSFELP